MRNNINLMARQIIQNVTDIEFYLNPYTVDTYILAHT